MDSGGTSSSLMAARLRQAGAMLRLQGDNLYRAGAYEGGAEAVGRCGRRARTELMSSAARSSLCVTLEVRPPRDRSRALALDGLGRPRGTFEGSRPEAWPHS
jgi:hypothetical protein